MMDNSYWKTDIISVNFANMRIASNVPSQYQLVKRGNEYILQGGFAWSEGSSSGIEWRDLPTIIEKEENE